LGARRCIGRGATLLALVAMAGACHRARVAPPPRHGGDLEARLDAVFASYPRDAAPGCAAALVKSGVVSYVHSFGAADLEQGTPIGTTTRFFLASLSKQLTATAILLLWREGKLSLDDDVRTFISELPDYGRPIRIHQLVRHTG